LDSGTVSSIVPAATLERLGIRPEGEQEFRLGDGTRIVRKKGVVHYRYGDRFGAAAVIFGEEGDSTILGSSALTALGLVLNPLKRELRPLPGPL
jgi:hypothetical protein